MSMLLKNGCLTSLILLLLMTAAAQAENYAGIGRPAAPAEIRAWDIDVRGDFKGLPKGAGSVAQGADVWEGKCASCHGVFGESNSVFPPLVGGTTPADVARGRVAGMIDGSQPYRTTLMKASQLSTLWDYINRAMPWNAPKSLSTNEVYAVTAYLLHLGDLLPADFVMSDANIREVQARLPNRNGKTSQHGLWAVSGTPDVKNTACMSGCGTGKVVSTMPDYARDAHGNLAEQDRTFGPYRGVDTRKAASLPVAISSLASAQPAQAAIVVANSSPSTADIKPMLAKYTCTACHGAAVSIVGPSFAAISQKHTGKSDSVAYLAARIKQGGQGAWGAIPMPAQTLPESDATLIAQWLVFGNK